MEATFGIVQGHLHAVSKHLSSMLIDSLLTRYASLLDLPKNSRAHYEFSIIDNPRSS